MAALEKPRASVTRTEFTRTDEAREDNASDKSAVSETTTAVRKSLKKTEGPPATRLSILFDTDSSQFVSRSVKAGTGEVVKQYPAESVLRRVAANTQLLLEAAHKAVDITV
jgi:uncharacterized FlaG/YvyC family protein